MSSPKTLVWLASYPKSGNTWLRAFLANYFLEARGGPSLEMIRHINASDVSGPAYARIAGRSPAGMPPRLYIQTRSRYLAELAGSGAQATFVKTHCANLAINRVALIPPALTAAAVAIVRHPLDVLVSVADHAGGTFEYAADELSRRGNQVPGTDAIAFQLMGSWSENVASWLDAKGFPVLVLRYEDILADPAAAFRRVLELIGAPIEAEMLARAVEASSFENLAALEARHGFVERSPRQERFFRAGVAGQGREKVPADLAERVVAEHRAVMERLGYQ